MISKITKSIFDKIKISCCIFTVMTLSYGAIGFFLFGLDSFTPKALFINLAVSFIMGFGSYVFAIPRINYAAKHILYFIITYAAFIILQGMVVSASVSPAQIFVLSIFLLIVYAVILVIYFLVKGVTARLENDKSEYKNQFKK